MSSLPFDDIAPPASGYSLELGAGRNPVGPLHFSPCVASDRRLISGLHVVCLAHKLSFHDGSFDRVVMCNPFKYGFKLGRKAESLLEELFRVLRPTGHIVVIGGSSNPYCDPRRIRYIAARFSTTHRPLVVEDQRIDARAVFPGHRFERTDGTETRPNWRTTIRLGQATK